MNPEIVESEAAGLRWRLQRGTAADAPRLLMLHGTGSSLESWRGCAQLLAGRFDLLIPDLPGHAGTMAWPDRHCSLPRMADGVACLLDALDWQPQLVIGHSAGAAVMLQMALAGRIAPCGLLSENGALVPFRGFAGRLFPLLARLMAGSSWLPQLVSQHAGKPRRLQRLIESTGSNLDPAQVELYRELLTRPDHVAGVFDMMAGWQLEELYQALPGLQVPLWLVSALGDRTVPPAQARQVAQRLPRASVHELRGLGHLAHEEAPDLVVALIVAMWNQLRETAACSAAASPCGKAR